MKFKFCALHIYYRLSCQWTPPHFTNKSKNCFILKPTNVSKEYACQICLLYIWLVIYREHIPILAQLARAVKNMDCISAER